MRQDMPSFGLFSKQKKSNPSEQADKVIQKNTPDQTENPATSKGAQIEEKTDKETQQTLSPEKQTIIMSASAKTAIIESTEPETPVQNDVCKTYLKAIPLRDLSDLEDIKIEIQNGNILILRITPLASKSVESVKSAVNELYAFTESISGDIARLGEERIVICPKNIKIWREKTPVNNEMPLSSTVA
jgi:SepF-like predicted cell division protein (DUF552 family)